MKRSTATLAGILGVMVFGLGGIASAERVRGPSRDARLRAIPVVTLAKPLNVLSSADGSKVFDFGGYDTVLFPNKGVAGPSVCVSVQKGCSLGKKKGKADGDAPMACKFCSTGRYTAFDGNLSAEQIANQAKTAFASSGELKQSKRVRVVFAGMGDSSFNADGVIGAMKILQRDLPNHSVDFVVASVGTPPVAIKKLGGKITKAFERGTLSKGTQVYLQLSMHAATDAKREYLLPVAKKANLDRVLGGMLSTRDELAKYVKLLPDPQYPDRQMVTLNYLMLGEKRTPDGKVEFSGNATDADLKALISLVKSKGAQNFVVRLSAYNPDQRDGKHSFGTVPEHVFDKWQSELKKAGVFVRRFVSEAADVKGGCGQMGQRGTDADRVTMPKTTEPGSLLALPAPNYERGSAEALTAP